MSLKEELEKKLPEYYPSMYRDGFTPQEILTAFHNTTVKRMDERNDTPTVNLIITRRAR